MEDPEIGPYKYHELAFYKGAKATYQGKNSIFYKGCWYIGHSRRKHGRKYATEPSSFRYNVNSIIHDRKKLVFIVIKIWGLWRTRLRALTDKSDWKKIFTEDLFDKELLSEIYEGLLKLNCRRGNNPIKKWVKIWTDTSSKRIYGWKISFCKDAQYYFSLGEWKLNQADITMHLL